MKQRSYAIVGICLLIVGVFISVMMSRGKTDRIADENGKSAKTRSNGNSHNKVADNKKVLVKGVGSIKYATKQLGFKPENWLRIFADNKPSEISPIESEIEWRNAEGEWPKIDVYYGDEGQILQIGINKGEFDSYPLDDVAIRDMQEMFGIAIVRLGYPDDLIDSGYSDNQFILATENHWNKLAKPGSGYECEITPVVVKVVPVTRNGRFSETNPYSKYMGQEFPMILVKTGRNH
jgi:hypothetical protein